MIGPGASKIASGGIVTVIDNLIENFDKDINIKYIVTMRPTSTLKRIGLYFHALFSIIINLMNRDQKIAHIHMSSRTSFYRKSTIIMLLKFFRIPIIIHLHSGEFDIFYSEELNSRMKRYVKWIYSLADKTILLTDGWQKWFKNTINTNESMVLYNGVKSYYDIDSLPVNNRENIILFLGRLNKKKGIYDLLYSFQEVIVNVPDATLKICGDGEIEECKQLANQLNIANNVHFLGWVDEEEKFQLLNQAKIYILPSYFEGLPMGMLEAMSAGIGIIATNVGGVPEAVKHEESALLIDAGSQEKISESIVFLLQNSDKVKELGENARDVFLKKFDIKNIVQELKKIYLKLLESMERNNQ